MGDGWIAMGPRMGPERWMGADGGGQSVAKLVSGVSVAAHQ